MEKIRSAYHSPSSKRWGFAVSLTFSSPSLAHSIPTSHAFLSIPQAFIQIVTSAWNSLFLATCKSPLTPFLSVLKWLDYVALSTCAFFSISYYHLKWTFPVFILSVRVGTSCVLFIAVLLTLKIVPDLFLNEYLLNDPIEVH